jgi:protoporphyrin/coproporphyrin ferrochelatase
VIGVLVMAYGSPKGPDDIEAYYTHIRGGRPPSPELLTELRTRYAAIGGSSPLHEITTRQVEALQRQLNATAPRRYRAYIGMKHAPPFVSDAVEAMSGDGITDGVGIVLAPHYSRMSIGTYLAAAETARNHLTRPLNMRYVARWGDHPSYLDSVADRLRAALAPLSEAERARTSVIFTAHSLPERILTWHDPYPDELHRSAAAVAERVGVRAWRFAYQSAGRTADPWLGPDVRDVMRDMHANGVRTIAACSVGFVADHLEVLYDLDVEAAALARELNVRFLRAESLNDHPLVIEALADLVQHHAVAASSEIVSIGGPRH